MINYEYPPLGGGGGVINKLLAEELGTSNSITLITSKFANQKPYERCNNVEIFRVQVCFRNNKNAATLLSMLSFFPTSFLVGRRLLQTRHFDVIHSLFVIPSSPSGFLLAKKFRLPHVLSLLGGDIYDPSKRLSPHCTPLLHAAVEKIVNGSDVVVGMSSDIIGRAKMYYDITRDITLIPHSIERPAFTPQTRDHLGYASDDILLVTVGRLIPRKAVQDLLVVVRELHNPKVKLLIIGDGPERSRLETDAKAWRISEQVDFLGNVSDETKFQILNISDIFVSSTQHEGFGLVFLEAMSVGLPIVTYNNGGHNDFLINNKTGFLVNINDIYLFTSLLRSIYEDKHLKKEISLFNKIRIENYYIERCAKKYQVLYNKIVQGSLRYHDVTLVA
ncbi:MAG: glycosyltransferase family 4 protein [Candidatus Tectomicrobia bacterium]